MMIDTIALDMDGVLVNWDLSVRTHAVADLGVEDWGPAKTWSIPFLTTDEGQAWYQANLLRVFMEAEPILGALDWERRLYYLTTNLHIVTSGEPVTEVYKKHWLARHDVRYDHFTLVPKGEPKSSAGADLYIDDGAHVIDEVLENTQAYAIILDAPYNRGENAPKWPYAERLLRAYSWHGIVRAAEYVNYKINREQVG